jgi:hypothetical protein
MTKILAMCAVEPPPPERLGEIMLEEVQVVIQQYVDSRLEQFWRREDGKGGVLLYSAASVAEAEVWVKELPLTREGFLTYELIPIEPLTQLGLLVQASKAAPV